MKGLVEQTDDGIFLVVKHGGIVQESKHPREGFTPIEVPNVRTGDKVVKYVKRYKKVVALIKKIDWYDREYEDTRFMGWKLLLDDQDGTVCTLDLPFESRVGTRFMKLAENIDYSEPVEFSAWRGPDDSIAFSVKQHDQNVPQKYTREDPGDCPPPVQGFNKKWNFDAQKEFLHERMVQVVIPKVQAVNSMNGHGATHNEAGDGAEGGATESGVLDRIKANLKDYAADKDMSERDAMGHWFGTRVWADVERIEPKLLEEVANKLADEVVPF